MPTLPLPPLNWLRAFEAAARHMSFTEAGRDLGVTQSAISQNIRLLEARLGQPLFLRHPHRLELTDAGKAYLPTVRDAFLQISAGTREVFGPAHGERLTIRTTPGFADLWLAPRLGGFYARAPGVSVRVLSTIWDVEFDSRDDVLEIRYGDGHWPGLQADRLTHDRIFPVASPAVGARLAETAAALAGMRLLHTVGFRIGWSRWLEAAGLAEAVDGESGDHFDTALLPTQLAEEGEGIALSRLSLVADRLADGRLVAPLAPALETEEAFYLVYPANHPLGPDAAAFAEWLRAEAVVAAEKARPLAPGTAV